MKVAFGNGYIEYKVPTLDVAMNIINASQDNDNKVLETIKAITPMLKPLVKKVEAEIDGDKITTYAKASQCIEFASVVTKIIEDISDRLNGTTEKKS